MRKAYEFIADLKRSELSRYCLEECEYVCCMDLRNFKLRVTPSELSLLYEAEFKQQDPEIFGKSGKLRDALEKKISELSSEGRLVKKNHVYFYSGPVCPRYEPETRMCQVHSDINRSEDCEQFPISPSRRKDFRTIIMDGRCQFIRQNWEDIFNELNGEPHLSHIILVPDYVNPAIHAVYFFRLPEYLEDVRCAFSNAMK